MVAEIHALASDDADTFDATPPAGVLRLHRKPKERQKRVIAFVLIEDDGSETAYTVPAKPGAEIGLKQLEILNREGPAAATYYMLITMLGEDGYRALMGYEDLPPEALTQVIDKINQIVNGAMEGPKAG